MRVTKQFSVSLVNKPGRLADMLAALGKAKVGFQALSVMDRMERGCVRFVTEAVEAAKQVLGDLNLRFELTDVLLVDVPPQVGGFRKICERLAAEHLNIDYAYSSFESAGKAKGGGLAVIKVNDLSKAQRLLTENGTMRKRRPIRRPVTATRQAG